MPSILKQRFLVPNGLFSIKSFFVFFLILTLSSYVAIARKHHHEVRNDMRPYIPLSTFGYYANGHLDVSLNKLNIDDEQPNDKFGLSLDKTTVDQMNPYLDSHQNKCILEEPLAIQHNGPILFFILDFKNLRVNVQCSLEWHNMHIYKELTIRRHKRQLQIGVSDTALFVQRRKRRRRGRRDISAHANENSAKQMLEMTLNNGLEKQLNIKPPKKVTIEKPIIETLAITATTPPAGENKGNDIASERKSLNHQLKVESINVATGINFYEGPYFFRQPQNNLCKDFSLPLGREVIDGLTYYNLTFSMYVSNLLDEGLYNLYFHACPNYKNPKIVSFNVDIEENNNGNYLSAGEMPLPALYFMMSLLFFFSGLFWVFILRKSKYTVYKIHYIMAVLVFLKSLSLMFHSINYHFIEKRGEHVETWAILYYIAHLLKGAVLFITIVLIGTGWTFIKHILSDKDKKIFMIVIPLQVLANAAQIITDETDQSDAEFRTWRNIFFFVDLVCCGAILFPIVWSIRHLHEASATDGKAAINLRKLKLFRQFYIMIVCYIYFTRIIVDLLQMTVVFQYAWLDEMFREVATYVFFVLTGYKFRPVPLHPYFTVPEDEDDEEVEVLTESGLTEGVYRTKPLNRNAMHSTTTIIEGNDDERKNLIAKRESSHEYD